LPDTKRRELCPQAAHHLRTGQGEQRIDARPWRHIGLERAAQRDSTITCGLHGSHTEWAIEQAYTNRLARDHAQHTEQMSRSSVRERHRVAVDAVSFVDKDQVQEVSIFAYALCRMACLRPVRASS
jgi:hypothetical protein